MPAASQETLSGKQSLSKYIHQYMLHRKWLPSHRRFAFAPASTPKEDRRNTLGKYSCKRLVNHVQNGLVQLSSKIKTDTYFRLGSAISIYEGECCGIRVKHKLQKQRDYQQKMNWGLRPEDL